MAYPVPLRPRTRRLIGDHSVVDALVVDIRAALAGEGGRSAGPDLVAARLDLLRGRLLAHFDDEERAGLLERVATHVPRRRPDCEKLRANHRLLLAALDSLRAARVEARRDPAWGEGVRSFLDALDDHEILEGEVFVEILDGLGEIDT